MCMYVRACVHVRVLRVYKDVLLFSRKDLINRCIACVDLLVLILSLFTVSPSLFSLFFSRFILLSLFPTITYFSLSLSVSHASFVFLFFFFIGIYVCIYI